MRNAGKRRFVRQPVEGEPAADGVKPYLLRRAADAQHRHAVVPDKTVFAQILQRVALAVVFGNHGQAGGAAVHGVGLTGEGEIHD